MAEFGVRATELSGPSMAGAQPLQPVQKDALTFDTGWLKGAGKVVEQLLKPGEDQSVKDIEDKYATGVSKLTQAVEQGDMSPSEFERRRVSLFRDISVQAGAKYGIAKVYQRLGKFNKDIEEGSGINENQARAKAITEAEDKVIASGIAEGFFTPEFVQKPETRQMALNIMQDKIMRDDMIKRQQVMNDEKWKNVEREQGLQKWQIAQRDQQRSEASRDFLLNNANTYSDSISLFVKQGQERIRNGEDPKVVNQELTTMMANQGNSMLAGMVDSPDNQATFRNMQNALATMGQNALDPTKLASFDEATFNLGVIAAQQAIITKQPNMLKMVGTIKLLGPSASTNAAVNMFAAPIVTSLFSAEQGQAIPLVRQGAIEPQKVMNSVIDSTFEKAKAGVGDKEAVAQATTWVNGIMRSLGESKPTDNANLSEALKTMSGKGMAAMVQNGTVDREALMSARVTYESYIQKDLYNRGKNFFNTPIQLAGRGGRPGEVIPVQSQISLEADEAGNLKAVPHFRSDAFKNDPGAQQSALVSISQLNKNLGDFGVMLRIEAHSMGRTDYAKVLEEYGENMFPNMFVNKKKLEGYNARGFDWNGGDPSLKESWVRRDNGKQQTN